jgi:hypothetical protein
LIAMQVELRIRYAAGLVAYRARRWDEAAARLRRRSKQHLTTDRR